MNERGRMSSRASSFWRGRFLDLHREIDRLPESPSGHQLKTLVRNLEKLFEVKTFITLDEIAYFESETDFEIQNTGVDTYVFIRTALRESYLDSLANYLQELEAYCIEMRSIAADELSPNLAVAVAHLASNLAAKTVEEIDHLREEMATLAPIRVRASIDEDLARLRADFQRDLLSYELSSITERATSAADQAESAAKAAESAAGVSGTATLSQFFEEFSGSERTESRWWRLASALVLLGSGVAAFYHLAEADDLTWLDFARRAAVGVPVAAFFGIATAEASLHRRHSLWAKHMAIQLKTIRAFAAELPEEDRHPLLSTFGAVVFGGPPGLEGRNRKSESVSDTLTDAVVTLATNKVK